MKPPKIPALLLISAILTLIGLALMVWSVLQPTPLPTILAMSLGQVFGTAAFGLFLFAIIIDLRRDARERKRMLDAMAESNKVTGLVLPLTTDEIATIKPAQAEAAKNATDKVAKDATALAVKATAEAREAETQAAPDTTPPKESGPP